MCSCVFLGVGLFSWLLELIAILKSNDSKTCIHLLEAKESQEASNVMIRDIVMRS